MSQLALTFAEPVKRYCAQRGDRDTEFWRCVTKTEGCWLWTGVRRRKSRNVFGTFTWLGKETLAHRFAWELERGELPTGRKIKHTCGNSLCVRVDHIELEPQSKTVCDTPGCSNLRLHGFIRCAECVERRCAERAADKAARAAAHAERMQHTETFKVSAKYCTQCMNMCFRRPMGKPCKCGQYYAPEDVTEAWEDVRSRSVSRWVEPPPVDAGWDGGDEIVKRGVSTVPVRGEVFNHERTNAEDLTGQTIAGCKVLGRAATMKRCAWWIVETPCGEGHRDALEGWMLKWREKRGEHHLCGPCRRERGIPKHPGKAEARTD